MLTPEERKVNRKEVNHAHYIKNSSKWGGFYPKSSAAEIGTGNLGAHRLDNHPAEMNAIRAELKRLGLRNGRD